MATSDQGQGLANKTDEEIQAELEAVKRKFYDRMDTQLEKDLILEEREKLALEKRNLDIQMEFLKQKMKKVYQDELDIREYLEPEVNNSGIKHTGSFTSLGIRNRAVVDMFLNLLGS